MKGVNLTRSEGAGVRVRPRHARLLYPNWDGERTKKVCMRKRLVLMAFLAACVGAPAETAAASSAHTKILISGRGVPGGRDRATRFAAVGSATWAPAYIVNKNPLWKSPIPGTKWISFNGTSVSPLPYPQVSKYVFKTYFSLPPSFHNPSLVVKVMADNSAAIYVNNGFVASQPCCTFSNFQTVSTFTDMTLSHFHAGTNTLRFVVGDFGVVGGLDYRARITWSN
jgi:hypothetical protein